MKPTLPIRLLLLVGALSIARTASAQPAPAPAVTPVQISSGPTAPAIEPALPGLGLMLAGGVPDGAAASLIYRPFTFLRGEIGGGYNLVSKGVRGGVSVVPFGAGPSATLEVGRFFEGDANRVARQFAGASFGDKAILERVGYDFVNAHLGLEFGSRRVTFFIHAGMSYVRGAIHNINQQLSTDATIGASTTVTFNKDPEIRLFTPSAKLGFIFYIL